MDYLSELNELNRRFCEGAEFLRLHVRNPDGSDYWTKDRHSYEDIDPSKEVYRSVAYANGKELLFVIDVDYYGEHLERAFEAAAGLNDAFGGCFFTKFSGSRGFHLISKIDRTAKEWRDHKSERKPYEDIQEYFKHILYKISEHVPGTTIDQEKARRQDLVWLDITMYRKNRLIRGLCVHLGSGLYSVPVSTIRDDLDDILARARLEAPMGISEIEFPEFKLYDLADPKDDIAERIPKKLSAKRFAELGRRFAGAKEKTLPEKFPPCVKKVISIKPPYHPSHMENYFLCAWLSRHGYNKEEITDIFKGLMGEKYSEKTTQQQVDYIVDKGYRHPSCAKIKREYGLCDPACKYFKSK